ncbi:MAG: DUF2808 domain-containing protein [Leptolyngbyaceae cyanobacterium CRU_2_3]|nr:DUF2808 domain-containing protein [Leptolyngbyaceae cyanobacterium CRU_2_3]
MRFISRFGLGVSAILALGGLAAPLSLGSQAVELRGQVYFNHPPTLVDAVTTERRTSSSGATYYFTLTVPDDAGEPLQRIMIAQQDSSTFARLVRYKTDRTRAFIGTPRNRDAALTVGETLFDSDTQTVTVRFDQPVAPGQTVTIGLRPVRNPDLDGIYLFGVTAYPEGENSFGQFLGYGRLSFDRSDRDFNGSTIFP